MSKPRTSFRGTFTALVTPMNNDGSIDFEAIDRLVDDQMAGGVEGLVPCGTTGESATLSADERQKIVARVVQRADGKIPVIAGTGGNNTALAAGLQKRALDAGATATLVVTPYYNKPTPTGLLRHYEAVASAADIPVVLYNVPGRTACDMKPETVAEVAKISNVVGVKEATADLDRIATIRASCGPSFSILSGDDATTLPFAALGGDGCISVASNVAPHEMSDMVRAGLEGRMDAARELHGRLRPLFAALFWESNPVPVKAALSVKKLISENYRLPLCVMEPEGRAKLEGVILESGYR